MPRDALLVELPWDPCARRFSRPAHRGATAEIDRLGMLANESWRACRRVVDTGLHALGWSRQQAIDLMVDHVPVNRNDLVVDVDRYIGWPAQALAYKVGQREVLDLRHRAETSLGRAFDVRAFHDTVLSQGSVSLRVLRDHVVTSRFGATNR